VMNRQILVRRAPGRGDKRRKHVPQVARIEVSGSVTGSRPNGEVPVLAVCLDANFSLGVAGTRGGGMWRQPHRS
jgi:hypothetical protein